MRGGRRGTVVLVVAGLLVAGTLYIGKALLDRDPLADPAVEAREPGAPPRWLPPQPKPRPRIVSEHEREDLLARAQLWRAPDVEIEEADFAAEPLKLVRCRFHVTELSGTTPKFDCHLESGELIRVKYGKTGEVPAEVATTRLLLTLGFGADHVQYVERLECYGCPEEPFSVMKAVEITQAEALYRSLMLDYDDFEAFRWVALERKFDGREIETDRMEGWGMFELDRIEPASGGASRAQVDALRLLAVFLAHWDNKPENQRIVCVSPRDWGAGERCERPFLLLQDVGSTFGPTKVDLDAWLEAPIWEDRATCRTSMRELPFGGATFGEVHISEDGRRFLADKLTSISERQLTDLFTTARFDDSLGLFRRSSAVVDWIRAFKARVRDIADGPPCPTPSA